MLKIIGRNFVVLLLCSLIAWPSYGQYAKRKDKLYNTKYGIKVSTGAILARGEIDYIGNEFDQVVHEIKLDKSSPLFSVGVWGKRRFGWLYTEADLKYSGYRMDFDVTSYEGSKQIHRTFRENFSYFDIQVTGGLVDGHLRLGAGPVAHILLGHNSELLDIQNYVQKLRRVSYGFSFLIGYDFNRFSLDLKYDKTFRTVGDHIYFKYKKSRFFDSPDVLSLCLSYNFGDQF